MCVKFHYLVAYTHELALISVIIYAQKCHVTAGWAGISVVHGYSKYQTDFNAVRRNFVLVEVKCLLPISKSVQHTCATCYDT
jgi:hypothetical protein